VCLAHEALLLSHQFVMQALLCACLYFHVGRPHTFHLAVIVQVMSLNFCFLKAFRPVMACPVLSCCGFSFHPSCLACFPPCSDPSYLLCPACFVLQNVGTAEDIDKGMRLGTNQPMGPLRLADFIGGCRHGSTLCSQQLVVNCCFCAPHQWLMSNHVLQRPSWQYQQLWLV
jgi:hypothetical protein